MQRLACFDRPTRVVELVKEAFGIEVSLQQLQHYDPTQGEAPAAWLCEIYRETREAFTTSTANIAIAHKRWRLEQLQALLLQPNVQRNPLMVMSLLEQAAKEMGGMYTNARTIEGRVGLSVEDLIAMDEDVMHGDAT